MYRAVVTESRLHMVRPLGISARNLLSVVSRVFFSTSGLIMSLLSPCPFVGSASPESSLYEFLLFMGFPIRHFPSRACSQFELSLHEFAPTRVVFSSERSHFESRLPVDTSLPRQLLVLHISFLNLCRTVLTVVACRCNSQLVNASSSLFVANGFIEPLHLPETAYRFVTTV